MNISRYLTASIAALASCTPYLCAQQWSLLATSGPAPRVESAMVYDSFRDRLVLFGGIAYGPPSTVFGDTWEFDGARWELRATSGPEPRFSHEMVYDPVRRETLLVGGQDESFWSWNGSQWTLLGQLERFGMDHCMTFDTTRGVVLMLGGIGGLLRSWDGVGWTALAQQPPEMSGGHYAIAYDATRDRLVCVGTANNGSLQTWEWDRAVWSLESTSGPSPRTGHSLVFDPARARTMLFGGISASVCNAETWEWDGYQWIAIPIPGPPASTRHVAAYDGLRLRSIVWGGRCAGRLEGETWEYRPNVRHATVSLGGGCSSPVSQPSLEVLGHPIIGNTRFALDVRGGMPGALTFLGVSALDRPGQVVGPCTIHPELPFHVYLWTQSSPSGDVRFPAPLPWDPGIVGATAFAQAGSMAPQGPLAGWFALTDGVRVLVGD